MLGSRGAGLIQSIQLLRNASLFESVSAGAQLHFAKLTVVYGENGRGKTTLAAILRSLATGNPAPIMDRRRLGANSPPHIVVALGGLGPAVFENSVWSRTDPSIFVFDDEFVAQNVCSGIDIIPGHRQNLH